jgi:cytochrome c-type biogenesis protein CcmE
LKKPKLFLAAGVVMASAGFGLSAFNKSLTPYVSFKEARAATGSVQVSGDVVRAKVQYDARTGTLIFPLKDHEGEVMTVVSHDGKPNNFDEAPKVVAIGRCENGEFMAERLLTKCPSKYEAEPGKAYPTRSSAPVVGASFAPSSKVAAGGNG